MLFEYRLSRIVSRSIQLAGAGSVAVEMGAESSFPLYIIFKIEF